LPDDLLSRRGNDAVLHPPARYPHPFFPPLTPGSPSKSLMRPVTCAWHPSRSSTDVGRFTYQDRSATAWGHVRSFPGQISRRSWQHQSWLHLSNRGPATLSGMIWASLISGFPLSTT
jgi:hypothetical protein